MTRKQYFLGIDTETTIDDRIADFAAVIVDRHGVIFKQCAVLIGGIFGETPLFYDKHADNIWSRANLEIRTQNYNRMLNEGTRVLASVNAVNKWLALAAGAYKPELFAYNLAFDAAKCENTGIDLSLFPNRFCLWAAAVGNICNSRNYKEFVLANHLFNNPTDKRNMTFSTSAESVAGFVKGEFSEEPHTALEDLVDFELPILKTIITKRKWREKITPYSWSAFQVKQHFKV